MLTLMHKLLSKIDLTEQEAEVIFSHLMNDSLTEVQKTAILIALKMKGETIEEISGAVNSIRKQAVSFEKPDYLFADIVGTGGDGSNTINISTAASFIVAEAGLPVVKHGNRAVSSKCGAADLLESFNVNLEMSPNIARKALDQAKVTFLYARNYHQSFKKITHIRQELATRTIFNLLGPLISPATPPIMLLGVYDPKLCSIFANVLKNTGCQRALIVHGSGLDEIAIHSQTYMAELNNGIITEKIINPSDFGANEFALSNIIGGNSSYNRTLIKDLLSGKGTEAHNSAVGVNAAALLYLGGKADNFKQAYELARSTIRSGKAYDRVNQLAKISHQ